MERDTIFYLRNRSAGRREFISGVLVGGGFADVQIQFASDGLGVVVDEEITLHFKHAGHFLNRDYLVSRVIEDGDGTRLKLVPQGVEPEDDDMRGSERIPMIYESMVARLGDQIECMLLDVSNAGIAVIGGGNYRCGDVLEFDMVIEGQRYFGEVTLRSAIEVRRGRFRYGLQCNADKNGHNLTAMLPDLWIALQIKYLETVIV